MKQEWVATRILGAILLAAASLASAGTNSWTFTGPYGGPVTSVAFHPSEPATELVGSGRGVHLSLTDGAFWARMFEGDINDISTVVFDPTNPARVFALGNSLHRSTDDARTFSAHIGPVGNLTSMSIARDGVLYVLDMFGRLFRSSNAGTSWTEIANPPWGVAGWPGLIAVDPSNSTVLYAAFRGVGIYKSTNAGATWSGPLPGSPGTRGVVDLPINIAVHPADGQRILVATQDGVMRSVNGGATWATNLAGTNYAWVGFDPATADAALALSWQGQIERSVDRGDTWPPNLRPPRLVVSETFDMALSPLTPGKILVATSEGPMFSEDGGLTFERRTTNISTGTAVSLSAADDGSIYAALRSPAGIYTRSGPQWYPVNNASLLDTSPGASDLRAVAVAPLNSSIVYSIDMNRRFMRSIDAGATWIGPHAQFSPSAHGLAGLAVDPTNPEVVYVGTTGTLWRSTDGGVTWQDRGAGLPMLTGQMAVSATNPSVIYASALTTPSTNAVYRSADAGLTWAPTGVLPDTDVSLGLTIDPTNPDIVYSIHGLSAAKSTNGGASWSLINFGLPTGSFYTGGALVVDPVHPTTLITTSSQPDLGFLRSVDGGATWQSTPLAQGGVRTRLGYITLNPQRPGLVVGGAASGGLAEYEISPDLGVTVEGLGDRVAIGGSATARIVVQNYGPHASSAAHVSVTLPTAFTVPTPPAGCGLTAGKLECDLTALQVGTNRTITLALTASATPAAGSLAVEVRGYEPDVVGANNHATAGAIVEAFSNLAVALSAIPAVTVGNSSTLVATVNNAGPHAAPSTFLEIELTGGALGLSATPSQGTCVANGSVFTTYKCDLGVVNSGGSATVSVSMRGDVVGAHTINAEVSSPNWDPEVANNTRVATLTVAAAPPAPPAPPPAPPKKKGGGGLDWLALSLLGGMLLMRARKREMGSDPIS